MPLSSEPVPPPPNRTIVTEEALHVSPDVLGLPLAGPWRRATAISVDALLVSVLANAPSVLFGFAAAYVLFRVSGRKRGGAGYIRRSFRFMFRLGGAIVLFGVAVSLWGSIGDRISGDDDRGIQASVELDGANGAASRFNLSGLQAVAFAGEVVELNTAGNEAEARAAAEALLDRMNEAGVSGADARETVRELVADAEGKPWLPAAVESVLQQDAASTVAVAEPAEGDSASVFHPDSLLVAYAAALSAGDSAAIDSLRPTVITLVAADTVGALAGTITSLAGERDEAIEDVQQLREELEEGPGVLSTLRAWAEDLGLGLGWFGLYFTATTAMWQGRTVGKRLLGIRVISLTGKPIGWWAAFERFGGYAAGFATGLLGFLQILWDDNRQAIHDKIAVTAVIRERAPPR